MPPLTDRQQAYRELEVEFLAVFFQEMDPTILAQIFGDDDFDISDNSDSDQSMSSDDSFQDSSDDDLMADDVFDSSSSSSDSMNSVDELEEAAERFFEGIEYLDSHRYLNERLSIPKTHEFMRLLLGEYKENHPDIFRSYLRVTPACFDEVGLDGQLKI